MILEDILFDVDVLVQNTISPQVKIRWINQVRRNLYRDIPLPESAYPFQAQVNKQFYALPDDCKGDNIISVEIGGNTYVQAHSFTQKSPDYFWKMTLGNFMIYPMPTETMSAIVIYNPTPKDFTVEDLSAEGFNNDFDQLLVYGCASLVAKSLEKLQLSNSLDNDFQRMKQKAMQDLKRNEIFTIRCE